MGCWAPRKCQTMDFPVALPLLLLPSLEAVSHNSGTTEASTLFGVCGFYGCHALPSCFTCRAKRPFWRVGAVTRYASNHLSLLSICLSPIASHLYSWAVYSAYALRIGRAISKLISNQYLRGCPLRQPLVYLILSLQPGFAV